MQLQRAKMRRDGETLSKKKDRLVNVKAEEAKARKFILELQSREIEALEKEDLEWRRAEEEDKSRVAKKREEEAKKRVEAAARKAQNRMLAQQEERDLEYYRKIYKVPLPELQIQMGGPNRAKKFVVEKPKQSRIVGQSDYSKMILVPNKNLIADREMSVEEAVDVMTERAHKLVWDKCNHWAKHWQAKWPGMKEHYTNYLYANDEDDDFMEYEDPLMSEEDQPSGLC